MAANASRKNGIQFRKVEAKCQMLAPPSFDRQEQIIEYRYDPLTSGVSIINAGRAHRVRQAQRVKADLRQLFAGTREGCPFCPENIKEKTPSFPPEIFPEGRLSRGDCTAFPNLYPFAEYHAVATLTSEHFLNLDQFTPQMLADNLSISLDYVKQVHRCDEEAGYPLWAWNYLPPSAASIVHPHVQITVRKEPALQIKELLERSQQYFSAFGRIYWDDLVQEERKRGERYIAENDILTVLASFAPQGLLELLFVFKEIGSLGSLNEEQVSSFAASICQALRGYKAMGVGSLNLVVFSAPLSQESKYFRLNAKLISRPFPIPLYTGDTGFMERLCGEWVIEALPEHVAEQMRATLRSQSAYENTTPQMDTKEVPY